MTSRILSIDEVIDRPKMGSFRWGIYAACACLLALEGFDAYLVSYLAPVIAGSLAVPISAMGFVFTAQAAGFAIAMYTIPVLADRIGRRSIIIACSGLFIAATFATTQVHDLQSFAIVRFLAFGALGGVIPNAIALIAEYLPKARQPALITWLYIGHGLGAAAAGWIGPTVVHYYSWQTMFWVGGFALLAAAPLLFFYLPESVRYLLLRNSEDARIGDLLHRVDPGLSLSDISGYATTEVSTHGFPVSALFGQGRAMLTVLLWISGGAAIFTAATLTVWLTSLFKVLGGVTFGDASRMVSFAAIGAIFGPIIITFMTKRIGLPMTLAAMLFAGGLAMSSVASMSAVHELGWIFAFAFGLFVIGSQSGLSSLFASSYPTGIRSTGIGWAAGMGRAAAIVGPNLVGFMLAAHFNATSVYTILAAPLFVAAVSTAAVHWIRNPESLVTQDRELPSLARM